MMLSGVAIAVWQPMDSGTTKWLYGVWGSSENNVFAVGEGGSILHYNGSTWLPMESGTTVCLYSVWGSSENNVLSQTPEGRELITLYYQWSPVIIKAMEEDEEFKEKVKELIDGILQLSNFFRGNT